MDREAERGMRELESSWRGKVKEGGGRLRRKFSVKKSHGKN